MRPLVVAEARTLTNRMPLVKEPIASSDRVRSARVRTRIARVYVEEWRPSCHEPACSPGQTALPGV
jgi:hypothetical protein